MRHLIPLLFLSVLACRSRERPAGETVTHSNPTTQSSTVQLSPEAAAYIDTVVAHMERVALHRRRVDFGALRDTARYYSRGATTPAETYVGIERAMRLLDDHHSSLLTPAVLTEYLGLGPEQIAEIRAGRIPHLTDGEQIGLDERISFARGAMENGLAYLYLPSFERIYYEEMLRFADSLQTTVRELDRQAPLMWVIDLRDNNGGAELPMILGLGPLLDNENGYYGIDAGGQERTNTFYRDGGYYSLDEGQSPETTGPLLRATSPYTVKRPTTPILLLTSRKTASSAEAVVAIFKGQSNVLHVGKKTNGLTSVNSFEVLPDNAVLNITVAYMADRNRQVYEQGIPADNPLEELAEDMVSTIERLRERATR